jgi:hypothetical protein
MTALAVAVFVATAPSSAFAISPEELNGTVWLADSTHHRATVDFRGEVEVKEGKEIYVEFLDLVDEVLVARIHWWNVSANINVVEYAIFSQVDDDTYTYTEATHPRDSGFPGIQGGGHFRLTEDATAQLTQLGTLLDGSASGFATQLRKVDKAPEVPIPQTYPAE